MRAEVVLGVSYGGHPDWDAALHLLQLFAVTTTAQGCGGSCWGVGKLQEAGEQEGGMSLLLVHPISGTHLTGKKAFRR